MASSRFRAPSFFYHGAHPSLHRELTVSDTRAFRHFILDCCKKRLNEQRSHTECPLSSSLPGNLQVVASFQVPSGGDAAALQGSAARRLKRERGAEPKSMEGSRSGTLQSIPRFFLGFFPEILGA